MASNDVKEGTEAGVTMQEKNVVVNPLSVDNDKQPKKRKHKSKLVSSPNENDDDVSNKMLSPISSYITGSRHSAYSFIASFGGIASSAHHVGGKKSYTRRCF